MLAVVSPTWPPERCGVADFAWWLAKSLGDHRVIRVFTREAGSPVPESVPADSITMESMPRDWDFCGSRKLARDLTRGGYHSILVHYSPFLYARRGIDPWMALFLGSILSAARPRSRPRPRLIVMFHEIFEPLHLGPRSFLRGSFQLVIALAIGFLASDLVVASQERRTFLSRLLFWKRSRIHFIPVGSNIPVVAELEDRNSWRRKQGIEEDASVVAVFGLAHPSKNLQTMVDVLARLSRLKKSISLVAIGSVGAVIRNGIDRMSGLKFVDLGFLDAESVSRALAAADVVCLPYVDGVSTRRTTFMACLAHGIPVVTTFGYNTEEALRTSGACEGVDPEDVDGMVEALTRILEDPQQARDLGQRGARLYAERFSWEKIGAEFQQLLTEAPGGTAP